MNRRQVDKVEGSLRDWLNAKTPTAELTRRLYGDFLQLIADAEEGTVRMQLPTGVIMRRDPIPVSESPARKLYAVSPR